MSQQLHPRLRRPASRLPDSALQPRSYRPMHRRRAPAQSSADVGDPAGRRPAHREIGRRSNNSPLPRSQRRTDCRKSFSRLCLRDGAKFGPKSSLSNDRRTHRGQGPGNRADFGATKFKLQSYINIVITGGARWIRTISMGFHTTLSRFVRGCPLLRRRSARKLSIERIGAKYREPRGSQGPIVHLSGSALWPLI